MSLPAILGGTPVCPSPPDYLKWPLPSEGAKEALIRTLESGVWGTLGRKADEFAARYADFCQVKRALPVLNGTVSLELIFRALGIGRGDEVIVPPYTFTASISAVVLCGAYPAFADIDPNTYTLSPEAAEKAITPKTRAILAVDLGGRPCDYDALNDVCKRHHLILIEDAAHAHGSSFRGKRAGGLGLCGSFSFQASKNLSCGEGGAITTDDEALYEKLWSLHHNGRAFGDAGYDHPELGTDARMDEWRAVILLEGLKRLESDNRARMRCAAALDQAGAELPFVEPLVFDPRVTENSYHLYVFKYQKESAKGLPRELFIEALAAENVCVPGCGYSEPIYDMEYIRGESFSKMTGRDFIPCARRLPANERAAREEGCWLYHSSLLGGDEGGNRILEAMERIASHADEIKRRAL